MSKLFFIFIATFLFGYEEPVSDKTAFEVLMFKTGVTSLTKDFQLEKENIANNTQQIKALKKEVEYLLQENIKLKLQTTKSDQTIQNKVLKKEIEKLKNKINTLEKKGQQKTNQKLTITEEKYKYAKVYSKEGITLNAPYPNAKVVQFYKKDTKLILQWCNKYGWCKLKDKDEYMAQYKLYFIKKEILE